MATSVQRWLRILEAALNEVTSNSIRIKIQVMREGKKDTYWGTSVRRYLTDLKASNDSNERRIHETGFIYVNLRDSVEITKTKLADIIIHELEHLVDNNKLRTEVIAAVNKLVDEEKLTRLRPLRK